MVVIFPRRESHPQLGNAVLMVRPTSFKFNIESFETNPNQQNISENNSLQEFDASVELLRKNNVNVVVLEDVSHYDNNYNIERSPDEIFPNNVFGTKPDGSIVVYPMLNRNRQLEAERLPHIRSALESNGFKVSNVSKILHGPEGEALEGTGSLVIDYKYGVVYMARSVRSSDLVVKNFVELYSKYFNSVVTFSAVQSQEKGNGIEFYHTNVVLSIGDGYAIICSECIPDESEKKSVLESLRQTGRDVIEVTLKQTEENFCCNALEVQTTDGGKVTIMSESAKAGFTEEELQRIEKTGSKIVALPISTIEKIGGGSARCMCMEIFLNKK